MNTDIDLTGVIDLHLHSGPDTRPRLYDDIDLARVCKQAGLRAILIKSHITLTADRATIAEKAVPGIRVFGSLALNHEVGGLNPWAVEAAIHMGAKEIWLPTSSAARHLAFYRQFDPAYRSGLQGITVLNGEKRLAPHIYDILDLIAQSDVILGTGHLSVEEIIAVVSAAREAGVRKIIITHPELAISAIPLAVQKELALPGVWFERCFVATCFRVPTSLDLIAESIRELGPARTILTTDLGLTGSPDPVVGWKRYLSGLMELGISWSAIERMTKQNPTELVDM